MPRNNQEFWEKELNGNKVIDRFVVQELKAPGWKTCAHGSSRFAAHHVEAV